MLKIVTLVKPGFIEAAGSPAVSMVGQTSLKQRGKTEKAQGPFSAL
jgi:hypothetical protein